MGTTLSNLHVLCGDEQQIRTLLPGQLKGELMGWHKNAQGELCVVTWNKKDRILRVYRMVSS